MPVRMLARLICLLADVIGRLQRDGAASTPETALNERSWLSFVRTRLAPIWRKTLRSTLVVLGFTVFVGLQIWIAYEIAQLRWWFIISFIMVLISILLVVARPAISLIFWLVLSPIVSHIFSLDWGTGLPALTFNRTVIYSLAVTLIVRAFVNKHRPRMLLAGEWLLIAFPVFVLFTLPFFHSQSVTSFLLNLMQRAGDLCLLYFVTKACVTKKRQITGIMIALFIVGIYSSAMAFYDHFTGKMSIAALVGTRVDLIWSDVGGGRAAGPFVEPPVLGFFLSVSLLVGLYLAGWSQGAKAKFFYFVSLIPMLIALYWTYTRASYIPFLVGVLAMPFLAAGRRKYYIALLTATLLLAITVMPVALANRAVYRRFTAEKPIKDRVVTNAALLNLIKHNPWFGVGLGNHFDEMTKYAVSAGGVPGFFIWTDIGSWNNRFRLPGHTGSHNTYLTFFADHGIVGGLIWLGTFLAFLIHLWRLRARSESSNFLGADFCSLALAILVGYIISLSTRHVEGDRYINYVVWMIIALVIRAGELGLTAQNKKHVENQ